MARRPCRRLSAARSRCGSVRRSHRKHLPWMPSTPSPEYRRRPRGGSSSRSTRPRGAASGTTRGSASTSASWSPRPRPPPPSCSTLMSPRSSPSSTSLGELSNIRMKASTNAGDRVTRRGRMKASTKVIRASDESGHGTVTVALQFGHGSHHADSASVLRRDADRTLDIQT